MAKGLTKQQKAEADARSPTAKVSPGPAGGEESSEDQNALPSHLQRISIDGFGV